MRSMRATTSGESAKASSAFNKLLKLLHDEHIKCLEAVRGEFDQDPTSHDPLGSHQRTSSHTAGSIGNSRNTFAANIDSCGFDDLGIGSPREPSVHSHFALQRDSNFSREDSCITMGSEQPEDLNKHEASRTMQMFALRTVWESMAVAPRESTLSRKSVHAHAISTIFDHIASDVHYSKYDPMLIRQLIIHPNSKKLLGWDFVGFLLISYEMIVLPLQTFEISNNTFLATFEWLGRCFWTVDIIVSTMRGYFSNGRLFMSLPKTFRRYLRSWFALDLFLVLLDWTLLVVDSQISGEQDDSLGVVQVLRITRMARMMRVLRLLKLKRLFSSISDFISTDVLVVYFRFTKPLLGILILTHWIACGWYGIGALGEEDGGEPDWLTDSDSQKRSQGYLYCTSLHWSLSQLVLGSIDVHAQNTYERLYTIAALMVGVVAFSTLIGGFTSAVEEVREINCQKTKQFSLLRRFLRDYRISNTLAFRIQKHCEYTYAHRKSRPQAKSVELLALISEQLKQELAKEMHTPELKPHPLFQRMMSHSCACLDRICRLALIPQSYAQGDHIFANDVAPIGMLVLTDGQCNYVQRVGGVTRKATSVFQEEWLCEPVLWTRHWLTHGKAKAIVQCRAVFVDALWFERVFFEVNPMDWELAHQYATEFVSMLNSLDENDICDLLLPVVSEWSSERRLRDSYGVPSFSHAVMSKVEWPCPRKARVKHSEYAKTTISGI